MSARGYMGVLAEGKPLAIIVRMTLISQVVKPGIAGKEEKNKKSSGGESPQPKIQHREAQARWILSVWTGLAFFPIIPGWIPYRLGLKRIKAFELYF